MMLNEKDCTLLRCPHCRAPLFPGPAVLRCGSCAATWPVEDELAQLFIDKEVRGSDRIMRGVYNVFAGLHDAAVRYLLPLSEFHPDDLRTGTLMSEGRLRAGYLPRLGLGELPRPRPDRPVRILEIGIGTGANLPLCRAALPFFDDIEYWGLDLSQGMLRGCRARIRRLGLRNVRLFMADAHALPFSDGSFDRVFHVGGISAYRDAGQAIAEMARVARPGTPIVIVDEGLQPGRKIGLYHRIGFRLTTLGAPTPRCPSDLLPPGARILSEEWLSRFYYCLNFTLPPCATRGDVERAAHV